MCRDREPGVGGDARRHLLVSPLPTLPMLYLPLPPLPHFLFLCSSQATPSFAAASLFLLPARQPVPGRTPCQGPQEEPGSTGGEVLEEPGGKTEAPEREAAGLSLGSGLPAPRPEHPVSNIQV